MNVSRIRRYLRNGTATQLMVFDAIARVGSFTRAAEELHMAQPTVSAHVKKLGESVGLPLFEQIGKRVYPTEAGRRLQATCREVFDAFARLDAEFNQLCLAACRNVIAASMMRLISTQNRRFWFMHHGRTLPREGVESHVEMARAIARGDADQAAKATERLLAYVEELARRSPVANP